MLCKNQAFWQWCRVNDYTLAGNAIVDEESAKLWLYMMCGIESRANLNDPDYDVAQEKFTEINNDFFASERELF